MLGLSNRGSNDRILASIMQNFASKLTDFILNFHEVCSHLAKDWQDPGIAAHSLERSSPVARSKHFLL